MDERDYWLGFSVFPGVGPRKFDAILKQFGCAKEAWVADQKDLEQILGEKLSKEFESFRTQFSIKEYKGLLAKKETLFITLIDEQYPESLKNIDKAPYVLYVRGDITVLKSEMSIAVVGTRKTTQYGREVTKMITEDLVTAGFTIVSGLALGVDAISHMITLENNGKTIAVLGCGVDCCYPRENQRVYEQILLSGGVIVSEVPLSQPANKGSFPARNRIIAGLSLGILVTEGAQDSGSLITANYGLEFGRKVFAVPGPITSSLSVGPLKLIEKGAKLVTSATDIIKELGISSQLKVKDKVKGETEEETKILELLQNESLHFDELVRLLNKNSSEVGSLLTLMEMKGLVQQQSGLFSLPA